MTVSDQIIAVLNDLCTKFGVAIDWTSENAIPYITELAGKFIRYEIATSAFYALSIIIAFCLSIKFMLVTIKKTIEAEWAEIYIIPMAIAIVSTATFTTILFCVAIPNIIDIITCFTFPEKMIFEYVSTLIN